MRYAITGLLAAFVLAGCGLLKPPQLKDMELHGDFSGKWRVNNAFDVAMGVKVPCRDTSVEITQTATKLTIGPREFSCNSGAYTVTYQAMTFALEGDQVLSGGQLAGTKSDSTLEIRLQGPWGSIWHLNLKVAGPLVHYAETMGGNASTTTADFSR